jgi:hypothetical protein
MISIKDKIVLVILIAVLSLADIYFVLEFIRTGWAIYFSGLFFISVLLFISAYLLTPIKK